MQTCYNVNVRKYRSIPNFSRLTFLDFFFVLCIYLFIYFTCSFYGILVASTTHREILKQYRNQNSWNNKPIWIEACGLKFLFLALWLNSEQLYLKKIYFLYLLTEVEFVNPGTLTSFIKTKHCRMQVRPLLQMICIGPTLEVNSRLCISNNVTDS